MAGPAKKLKAIRDLLECPVCLKIIKSTPIQQCVKGHIHCKDCRSKLKKCPLCREVCKNCN